MNSVTHVHSSPTQVGLWYKRGPRVFTVPYTSLVMLLLSPHVACQGQNYQRAHLAESASPAP